MMFKIPLAVSVLFVLSWSALLDILLKISVTKRKVWQEIRWGAVSVSKCDFTMKDYLAFMNNSVESLRQGLKVLLPVSELWSWRLGIHLSNSVVTFRVKFHTNFTMMGSEQNFDVGNGEMEKEATEKQLSLATFTSWSALSFFMWKKVGKHFTHSEKILNAYTLNSLEHMVLAAIFHLKQNKSHLDHWWPWPELFLFLSFINLLFSSLFSE